MLDDIREHDIIVVWKLDRLARSTRDLLETMETIREAGGRFQSISEPWADVCSLQVIPTPLRAEKGWQRN